MSSKQTASEQYTAHVDKVMAEILQRKGKAHADFAWVAFNAMSMMHCLARMAALAGDEDEVEVNLIGEQSGSHAALIISAVKGSISDDDAKEIVETASDLVNMMLDIAAASVPANVN